MAPVRIRNLSLGRDGEFSLLAEALNSSFVASRLVSFWTAADYGSIRRSSFQLKKKIEAAAKNFLAQSELSDPPPLPSWSTSSYLELKMADEGRPLIEAYQRLCMHDREIKKAIQSKQLLCSDFRKWLEEKLFCDRSRMEAYLRCTDATNRPLRYSNTGPDEHYLYQMLCGTSARHLASWERALLEPPTFPRWQESLKSSARYSLPLPNLEGRECHHHSSGFCLTMWPLRHLGFLENVRRRQPEVLSRQLCKNYRGKWYCVGCYDGW
jgi:hypothetical protein